MIIVFQLDLFPNCNLSRTTVNHCQVQLTSVVYYIYSQSRPFSGHLDLPWLMCVWWRVDRMTSAQLDYPLYNFFFTSGSILWTRYNVLLDPMWCKQCNSFKSSYLKQHIKVVLSLPFIQFFFILVRVSAFVSLQRHISNHWTYPDQNSDQIGPDFHIFKSPFQSQLNGLYCGTQIHCTDM